MEQTLARFVHALRNAGVVVTPSETLDAMAVLNQVGLRSRRLLKDALSLTLAKSVGDKYRFSACFDEFFGQFAFNESPKHTMLDSFDHNALLGRAEHNLDEAAIEVTRLVLTDERTALAYRVQQVAVEAGIHQLHTLRDKPLAHRKIALHMGLQQITDLRSVLSGDLATAADYVRHYVTTQIKDYVDRQYELNADTPARSAILEAALKGNIANISPEYQQQIDEAITQLAEALRQKYKRRYKRQRRGQLDVRHMLRKNIAYDGHLFELSWRSRKSEQGNLFVLCDVSGSVARVSRFLLLLLHGLSELLPELRSFAFSNQLGEITQKFAQHNAARAVEGVLFDWGHGATDYGRALFDFRALAGSKLNHKSTVIVVGDARSNFYDPHVHVLKEISKRAKQVLWLNPEAPDNWGEGDSEMMRYAPFCFRVQRMATLADLRHLAERLIEAR